MKKQLFIFSQDGIEICTLTQGKFTAKPIEIDNSKMYVVQIQHKNGGKIFNCGVYFSKALAENEIHRLHKTFSKKNIDGFQFAVDDDATALTLIDELTNSGMLQPNTDDNRKKILVQELISILLADIQAEKIHFHDEGKNDD